MKYWFTADCHFGHGNIIEYCKRPFADVKAMNNALIENWLLTVGKEDTVFHLGDFSFMSKQATDELVAHLPGKIIFLRGNHEGHPKTIIDSLIIRYDGHGIMLTHYPERATPLMTTFCGHIHEKWVIQYHGIIPIYKDEKPKSKGFPIVNVGVDVWGFKPVDFETLNKFIKKESE
jgi:calcineurin-like phosphoesterase family protein